MGFLSNLFGGGPKTTVVQSKIPEELAPYVTEVNREQQELYRRRLAEDPSTYQYQGQTIADLTQDQLDARGGIRGLVGSTADDYALARQGITGGDERFKTDISPERIDALQRGDYGRIDPTVAARGVDFTGAPTGFTSERFQEKDISEYMNPYQRAVTDIEKRKAQEDFAKLMPEFEKQAVSMGGMSGMGSRAGVQAGLLGAKQMERLGDLEKTGLLEAYQDAQSRKAEDFDRFRDQRSFEERERSFLKGERDYLTGLDIGNIDRQRGERAFDVGFDRDQQAFLKGERDFEKGERTFEAQQFADRKKRERQQAQDLQSLAKGRYGQQMREYGALESLGADAEKRAQKGLDRSYADWLERRERPETLLGRYTSAIYGNPMLAKPSQTTTTPGVPFGQQMLGIGTAIAGAGGFNPFFGAKAPAATGGGIASLMPTVYRDNGGMMGPRIGSNEIRSLDYQIEKQRNLLEMYQKNAAAGNPNADAQAKRVMMNLQQNLLPKRSALMEDAGAKKFKGPVPPVTESEPQPPVPVGKSIGAARQREILKTAVSVAPDTGPAVSVVSVVPSNTAPAVSAVSVVPSSDGAAPAVSSSLFSVDSIIGPAKERDPKEREMLDKAIENWENKKTEAYKLLEAYNKRNIEEEIGASAQKSKADVDAALIKYMDVVKNSKDEEIKYLKESMPPGKDYNELLVLMGLHGATHPDGFLAGAAIGYEKWSKNNKLNEKETRAVKRALSALEGKFTRMMAGKTFDFQMIVTKLDAKTREKLMALPAQKLAEARKNVASARSDIEAIAKIRKMLGGGSKTRALGKGQSAKAIGDQLRKSPQLMKAIGYSGTEKERLGPEIIDETPVSSLARAIRLASRKMFQANPKRVPEKGISGTAEKLEDKIINDILAKTKDRSINPEDLRKYIISLYKYAETPPSFYQGK